MTQRCLGHSHGVKLNLFVCCCMCCCFVLLSHLVVNICVGEKPLQTYFWLRKFILSFCFEKNVSKVISDVTANLTRLYLHHAKLQSHSFTWSYRKTYSNIVSPPCKVSNPTHHVHDVTANLTRFNFHHAKFKILHESSWSSKCICTLIQIISL